MCAKYASPFAMDSKNEIDVHQLIANTLAGYRTALKTLLTRHQPYIFNIAFRMILVHEDAKDITQEIMIKMLTKLSSFDPSKAAFRTWLYRIVANHVINMKIRGYEAAIPCLIFETDHSNG